MRPLRVAVVGAFNSGKTTLSTDLRRSLGGLSYLVEEQARRAIRVTGPEMTRDPAIRSYLLISQALAELEAPRLPVQISDGSIINNLAHDAVLLNPIPNRAALLDSLKYAPYDLTLVCEHKDIPIEDDAQRFTDPTLRDNLLHAVCNLLPKHSRQITFLRGSARQRLAQAQAAVWRLLLDRDPELASGSSHSDSSKPQLEFEASITRADAEALSRSHFDAEEHRRTPLLASRARFSKTLRLKKYWYYLSPLDSHTDPLSPALFHEISDAIMEQGLSQGVDLIVCLESMGIHLAACLSMATGIPYIIARKKNLGDPVVTFQVSNHYESVTYYIFHEIRGKSVLILDDVASSGQTLKAAYSAISTLGAHVRHIVVAIGRGSSYTSLLAPTGVPVTALVAVDIDSNGNVTLGPEG